MNNITELMKVAEITGSDGLLFTMIVASVTGMIKYIKRTQQDTRNDLKELHKNYRADVCELMNRSRDERIEQRLSLEKISLESNKVMTKLTMTVTELKVMVDSKLR